MVTKNSQIALYKKIDHKIIQDIGINLNLFLKYNNGLEEKNIIFEEDSLAINEYDETWSPNDHELILDLSISILEPNRLFGENGVTASGNKIGLAYHMYSKESQFQRTVPIGYIKNIRDKVDIKFNYTFPPSSLRGHIYFEVFIYLAELNEEIQYHANKTGMILTQENLYELELIVDGDGSVFPMTEFDEKNGPLWKMEKHWVDASDAIFDSSNVNISLNTAHPLFDQVQKGKTRISRAMMGDIMIQAMSQIIQQVMIIENNSIDDDDVYPNSVLAAVKYWVESFEIKDLSSLFSISNSLRAHWERKLMRGENEHD